MFHQDYLLDKRACNSEYRLHRFRSYIHIVSLLKPRLSRNHKIPNYGFPIYRELGWTAISHFVKLLWTLRTHIQKWDAFLRRVSTVFPKMGWTSLYLRNSINIFWLLSLYDTCYRRNNFNHRKSFREEHIKFHLAILSSDIISFYVNSLKVKLKTECNGGIFIIIVKRHLKIENQIMYITLLS